MAGKRQHFIPRFLQRGFSSHFVRDEAFTWVYRKGTVPFNSNIKNVGVEGLFYSSDDDFQLDASITTFEADFNEMVCNLRTGKLPTSVNTQRIAEFLAHLEVRTRSIRQSFLEAGTYLVDKLMKFVTDEEAFARYFQRALQRDPSLLEEAMANELRKRGIPLQFLPQVLRMSKPLLKQMMPGTVSKTSAIAQQLRTGLPSLLEQAAKAGHIKALTQTLAPEVKVRRLAKLRFNIAYVDRPTFVLGDSVVLFHVGGERRYKPFLENKDELIAVLLPVSAQHLLVGSAGCYEPDLLRLRQEIARCSLEHFVSSQAPPIDCDLAAIIGDAAYLAAPHELEKLLDEVINQ